MNANIFGDIKKRFGTDAQAAKAFGISLRTFQRWKHVGKFPRLIYYEKAMQILTATPTTPPADASEGDRGVA